MYFEGKDHMIIRGYIIQEILGKGCFGTVYQVSCGSKEKKKGKKRKEERKEKKRKEKKRKEKKRKEKKRKEKKRKEKKRKERSKIKKQTK